LVPTSLESTGVDAVEEEYMALAEKMVDKLKTDPNVLAIMVYGSVATRTVTVESDIDLLLLVKEIPDDVDMFGIKRTSMDGIPVDLAHKTVEQVLNQIDYEAGSWYSSSVMLNSVILHDPEGEAETLRKKILEMSDDQREFIYDCLMGDAKTYPDKIRQSIELGDYRGATYLTRLALDSLVQVIFMANRTRPASEKGMVRNFFALDDVPQGFLGDYDFIEGFNAIDMEKASAMLEAFKDSIKKTEEFWRASR